MRNHRAGRLWLGLWTTLALAGCGGDGGGPDEPDLNLEEQQISAAGVMPSLAMAPDGRFAVAFEGVPPSNRLQVQRFTADGFKDGTVIDVAPAQTDAYLSRLAYGPRNDIFVAWSQGNIHVQRYAASGSPLGPPALVHSSGHAHAIDIGPGGQGVVVWSDAPDGSDRSRLGARRLAADGSAAGPDLILASNLQGVSATAAVLAGGSFVVAWQQFLGDSTSQLQRFGADGTPAGARISLDLLASSRRAVSPRVDAEPGGGFVVLWQDSRSGLVEGQRFAADGSQAGGRFTLGGFDAWSFSVAPDGAMVGAASVNTSGSTFSITARRLTADGAPQGAEFPVASGLDLFLWGVASGPRGRFFVLWTSPSGVRGRLLALV
jgi:hypothetical protein